MPTTTVSFRVPESFGGPSRRELGALARYRIARLERELRLGAWLVELTHTADGFACRATCDFEEGAGEAPGAVHALEEAMARLEVRLRRMLVQPDTRRALAG